jgi:hypothetical protein
MLALAFPDCYSISANCINKPARLALNYEIEYSAVSFSKTYFVERHFRNDP